MKITLQQVQTNISNIANRHEYKADVIYELLAAYGRSKSAITQLREGHFNKAEDVGAVLQKDVVYFKTFTSGTSLEQEVIKLYKDPLTQRYNPRYLIATDLTNLAAKDNLNKDTTLTIKLADIDDHLDFFYGWTGDEVVDMKTEAVADRRAADKMNELYVEIEKQNRAKFVSNPKFRHELNVFFTRLLFCFFAEDTGIYDDGQFTTAIKTYTQTDGSDLVWFFGELFTSLDMEDKSELKSPFKEFPYVNGSIFNTKKHEIAIPKFSAQARHLILECGRQNWGEINPDIFGTIFQGVVDPEHRDENGMDYTSVPNIMKVIKPLFLDGLHEQFDKYYDNEKKLWALLGRVQKIKVFDPACGSGNFLIIAYKELRQLQHAIIGRIDELMPTGIGVKIPDSQLININNFYGIEIDDFAHELAVLSLFLAKHQMNQEFTEQFGKALSIIPLIDIPTIKQGNAARLDWQKICPNIGHAATKAEQESLFDFGEPEQINLVEDEKVYDEIYLIGNPPYKGARKQTADQKSDFKAYFGTEPYSGDLDYISIWFIKGARYISDSRAQLAFVSTSSVCQGAHPGIMFPKIFDEDVELGFAYSGFKWQNSARDQAGVVVIIVSLRPLSKSPKYIFVNNIKNNATNINPYLIDSAVKAVTSRNKPLSSIFPKMTFGNMSLDGGNLVLTNEDHAYIINKHNETADLFKRFVGAEEYINGKVRYCLWLDTEEKIKLAQSIPEINERIERTREFRLSSKDAGTRRKSATPHSFREMNKVPDTILLPRVSSERRQYLPVGFIDNSSIVSDSALAIYGGELYLLSIIMSAAHMIWFRTTAGYLGTSFRYSKNIVYNNFPIQPLTESEKVVLNKSARRILLARAAHPEKTLADMYDPDKMPDDLREAHEENDHLVDNLYRRGGFTNDEDRLAALFDLYEQMIERERLK